jgi:hypothetical protein
VHCKKTPKDQAKGVRPRVKLRWKLGIALPTALLAAGTVCWFTSDYCRFWMWAAYQCVRPVPTRCKQRAADFEAREKRIEANAKISLKPGTKKADVTAFFSSEKIPMDSYQIAGRDEVSGQIYVKGLAECASVACGDDSAMIGVRVEVDESGTVVSDPVVVGMYTDCL